MAAPIYNMDTPGSVNDNPGKLITEQQYRVIPTSVHILLTLTMPKNNGTSYFFSLPDDNEDYHSVRVIETEIRTGAGMRGIVPKSERIIDVAKDKWERLSSWAPVDSTEYVLDPPGGTLFMETAIGNVFGEKGMEMNGDGVKNKKKRTPRSKLSVR
ncbi:hypothetical protein BJ165DRAFT_1411443 [Panaeolus papilionaceus]|nr:hypothetical protein BJ165DRAFT_1411443 [Panaeolus papilionaceus]